MHLIIIMDNNYGSHLIIPGQIKVLELLYIIMHAQLSPPIIIIIMVVARQ